MPDEILKVPQNNPQDLDETTDNIVVPSGLKLQVGDTLQMELVNSVGQSQQRYITHVIGYVTDKSILVTTPTIANGKVVLIRIGQLVNIRLLAVRRLIGFRSNVLRSLFTPYPYIHLSYPQELSSVELRRTQRITVNIIVGVESKAIFSNKPIPALILDISIGGALIESARPLGIAGDNITIAIRLMVAQMERYLSLVAVIRTIQGVGGAKAYNYGVDNTKAYNYDIDSAKAYNHGVEFLPLSSEDTLVLHGFVYEQIVNSLIEVS